MFRRLPPGDAAAGLVGLLARASGTDALRNFVPRGTTVTSEAEDPADETMHVGLSEDFWELPDGERYAAAAQIVYTLATLEEGKRILLLDGTVPGRLVDGNGSSLEPPLTRASFAELEPWIQVVQPVAGATVGRSFPVQVIVREALPARAEVSISEGATTIQLPGGRGEMDLPGGAAGDVTLRITVRAADGVHSVELPLTVAG